MKEKMTKQVLLKDLPGVLIGIVGLILGLVICPDNHYLAGLLLLVCAVCVYVHCVFVQTSRNWLDIRGVFSAIWIATIGLAVLRLTDYQVLWETETWICQIIAYIAFHVGANLGIHFGGTWFVKIKSKNSESEESLNNKDTFRLHRERLFPICVILTIFGIACFVINICIRGYIPFFAADGNNAYIRFYTKWYFFAVAATIVSGLDYYVIKTQSVKIWQKVFLWFSIIYSVIIFPILIVNRSALLSAGLSLITVVFYLNRKKFTVLLLSVIVLAAAFGVCTSGRGYSEAQLKEFFEPSKIEIGVPESTDNSEPVSEDTSNSQSSTEGFPESSSTDDSSANIEDNPDMSISEETDNKGTGFELSGTAAFIYTYLTVSHDNLNEAVLHDIDRTYGALQFTPFNVILRIPSIQQMIDEAHIYKVRDHLTTINLIGYAYYDFGVVGVVVFMLLWSFAFGVIQACYEKGKGIFSLMALGVAMTPIALCFFDPWMSEFIQWVYWGEVLILFMVSYVSVNKIKSKNKV